MFIFCVERLNFCCRRCSSDVTSRVHARTGVSLRSAKIKARKLPRAFSIAARDFLTRTDESAEMAPRRRSSSGGEHGGESSAAGSGLLLEIKLFLCTITSVQVFIYLKALLQPHRYFLFGLFLSSGSEPSK